MTVRQRSDLRRGQVAAATHLYERDETFLIGECGFGKTVVVLTALRDLFDDGIVDRAIIAAPPAVARSVWPAEPPRWAHLASTVMIDGTGSPKQRKAAYAEWLAVPHSVLTVTIPNIATIEKELRGVDLSRVALVADEVSMLKAPTGVLSKAAEKLSLRCAICWGATATPRPNGWEDLFRPVRIVSRGKLWSGLGGFEKWRAERFAPLDRNGYNWRVHGFAAREMETEIAPLFYRAQEDTIAGLLELREGADHDRYVDLPDAARGQYKQMEKELFTKVIAGLRGATTEEVVFAMSKASASAKLEQLANGFLYDEGEAVAEVHDAKLQAVRDLLDEIGPRENVLLAFRFKHDLAMLRRLLGDFPALSGEATAQEKGDLMKKWNSGRLPLLGIHPASAGHGIELQNGGRRIIWFSPTWSSEQAHQTTRRIFRSGQLLNVYSHRIIARDTIDVLKAARCEGNTVAQAEFLERM